MKQSASVPVAAARELRDRWLEQVNADPGAPGLLSQGKYDVSRQLEARSTTSASVKPTPLLDAA